MQGDIMEKNFYGNPFKLFMSYVAGHKKLFAIDMGCALLVSVIDLAFPYVSKVSMNSLLPNRLFALFFTVMGIMVAAYVIKAALYYIITVVGHRMGVLIEADMRRDVFTHMQDLSCSFYDKNRTGVLMSRITSDLFEITELSHHGPENILICTLTIVGALAVMFTMEWRLALTLAIVLPLCLWFTLSQRVRMKKANIEVKKKTADIYAAIESSISGIRTAKAFANEEQERGKFDEANAMFKGAKVEYYRTMGLFQSGMDFTCCIAQVLVITVGGLLIMQNSMDYVDLVTFSLYVSTFISPIRKLAQFSEQYMNGSAGFTRFIELMQTQPTVKDKPEAIELDKVSGRVDYDKVCFDYGNGVEVLKDIDLHIEPGKCLAVVGPSGGGKTTLCQLLPRFYDVCSGMPAAAQVLRRVLRQREGGRHRRAGHKAEQPAPEHRHDTAGRVHVRRHHPGEHPLRPARRHRRGDSGGGGEGPGPQGDNGAAPGLRQLYRRAGRHALRGPEAEDIHRPGVFEKSQDTHPGRGHLRPGHRHRAAHPGVPGRAEPGPHHHHHRPPALHREKCGHDSRGGGGAHHRDGHP